MKKLRTLGLFFITALTATLFVVTVATRVARTSSTLDPFKICASGTASSGGGTYTCSYAIPTDRVAYLKATVIMSQLDAGHIENGASFGCDYVVENSNGTLSAPSALNTSANTASNPVAAIGTSTSARYMITSRAEASDPGFLNSGSGIAPTCTWSISGTNAVLTVTNNGSSSRTADVTARIEALIGNQ